MANNRRPKSGGYTPNRPEARTQEEAKKLGLNPNGKLHGQEGTSSTVRMKGMLDGSISLKAYHEMESAALKKTLERGKAPPKKPPSVGAPRPAKKPQKKK